MVSLNGRSKTFPVFTLKRDFLTRLATSLLKAMVERIAQEESFDTVFLSSNGSAGDS